MPLDSTTVIGPRWSGHHRAAARGAMGATVTVGTAGATVYNPATDDTTVTWSVEYAGPARVQALTQQDGQRDLAGQQVSGRLYLVQLDAAVVGADLVAPGMRVRVVTAPNDALLAGQDLWVVDVQMGSERFTRDVVCSDNATDAKVP